VGMILDTLVVAVTTQATFSILEAFKIKRVELWASVLASSTEVFPNVVSLEFNGSGGGNVGTKPSRMVDTSMGASRNACVSIKPPKGSAASMWQVNPETGTQTAGGGFIVSCPLGSVLDITMSCIIQNNSPVNAGPTANTASLVVGTVYQAPLDGTAGNWQAIGYPSITV